jgi:hypothetical protein
MPKEPARFPNTPCNRADARPLQEEPSRPDDILVGPQERSYDRERYQQGRNIEAKRLPKPTPTIFKELGSILYVIGYIFSKFSSKCQGLGGDVRFVGRKSGKI